MLNLTDMRKRRKFDREFKQMVIELRHNREDTGAKAKSVTNNLSLSVLWASCILKSLLYLFINQAFGSAFSRIS